MADLVFRRRSSWEARFAIVAAVAGAIGGPAWAEEATPKPEAAISAAAVATSAAAPPSLRQWSGPQSSACLVEPKQLVKLASAIQGTIKAIPVVRGQAVKAGEVVVSLESDVEEAQLAAAKLRADTDAIVKGKAAELDAAVKKLTRARQLVNVISAQRIEEAETAAELARQAHDQAKFEQQVATIDVQRLKATIERRMIRSPVDGVVTRVDMHAGEYADPQIPILFIAEIQPLRIEVYLPASAYLDVRAGQPIEILPKAPIGGRYVATVATKDPFIDSPSGTFQITVLLPNADGAIPSGIRCDARMLSR